MSLNFRIYCFGLVLVQMIGVSLGLRYEQLVKFSCEICTPDPNECCVGTVMHKDLILTTSYCATSCQSVYKYDRNIDIIKTYKQPRLEAKTRHDIALVVVNIDWKLDENAKLNFVNATSAIGLTAHFPFMDDGNTRMRQITLERCGKPDQDIYSRHVCGAKDSTRTLKKCYQRQGVPLLLEGKVIAITAATNNKLCNDAQMVFNTLFAEHAWIKTTIAELYPDSFELNDLNAEFSTTISISQSPSLTWLATQTPDMMTKEKTLNKTTTKTSTTTTTTSTTPAEETITTTTEQAITNPTEPTATIYSTQTDAMEWFNLKVRNKIKSSNRSYAFVLATDKPYSSPFIDLTF